MIDYSSHLETYRVSHKTKIKEKGPVHLMLTNSF